MKGDVGMCKKREEDLLALLYFLFYLNSELCQYIIQCPKLLHVPHLPYPDHPEILLLLRCKHKLATSEHLLMFFSDI